jgi:hypothetical protein
MQAAATPSARSRDYNPPIPRHHAIPFSSRFTRAILQRFNHKEKPDFTLKSGCLGIRIK